MFIPLARCGLKIAREISATEPVMQMKIKKYNLTILNI